MSEGPALSREVGHGQGFLQEDERKFYSPPAERNKRAILDILRKYLSNESGGTVLEVSSGSGQHVGHFAPAFPDLKFLPTEYPGMSSPMAPGPQKLDEILGSIDAYCEELPNVLPAIYLDAASDKWASEERGQHPNFTAVICINLCHISPYVVTEGLFAGSARTLRAGGYLLLYGPFKFGEGPAVPESNEEFDKKLKSIDAAFGLRNVDDLDQIAAAHDMTRVAAHGMPANNHTLVYQKKSI